ncbi:hypothetical protein EB001_16795 [bacterium]|nr:hypothetical protein [bacterium]
MDPTQFLPTDTFQLLPTCKDVIIYSNMKDTDIINLFKNNIVDFDLSKRYVAVQKLTGDCVIYENGQIDRVSDSG